MRCVLALTKTNTLEMNSESMKISRRTALSAMAGAPALLLSRKSFAQGTPAAAVQLDVAPGRFKGTRDSLREWQVPDWFRDAKFGVWAHWGPQSAIEYGDWYARNMYIQGSRQYEYHVKAYGHPTKVGYKDVIPLWKADKFDPDHLLGMYKKAGAKYFCSMAVHHDNFDLWQSKHQPRWNAVAMGPKRDIVGAFKRAAEKHDLRFAVSEHLAPSYHWFAVSHMSDKTGPLAGVPYDGANPAYADLYHDLPKYYPYDEGLLNDRQAPDSWKTHYFKRIKDLIDNYQPDLLYTDGDIFFEEYGLALVANLYNASAQRHGGRSEAVYFSKLPSDCATGTCVLDWERGVAGGISANPWQTDTCIGDWHYNREARYKTPKYVIDLLVDIVSRNGNLLLNFPLPNSGQLDYEELVVLDEITKWMAINSEGIYATRPWKTFGDGPIATAPLSGGTRFNESSRKELTADEVRFTTKGQTLYAFVMGWPRKQAFVKPLATTSKYSPPKIQNVELLGFKEKVKWAQDEQGLVVEMPEQKPCDYAITLKIV
jgi:alpha-L-fucosidase